MLHVGSPNILFGTVRTPISIGTIFTRRKYCPRLFGSLACDEFVVLVRTQFYCQSQCLGAPAERAPLTSPVGPYSLKLLSRSIEVTYRAQYVHRSSARSIRRHDSTTANQKRFHGFSHPAPRRRTKYKRSIQNTVNTKLSDRVLSAATVSMYKLRRRFCSLAQPPGAGYSPKAGCTRPLRPHRKKLSQNTLVTMQDGAHRKRI
jgi:hypothetical protein